MSAPSRRLIEHYHPPADGLVLESLLATTYQVDFDFLEEELLPVALGVRTPVSRQRAFRWEMERQLQRAEVSILYDLKGAGRSQRLSPRIDAVPLTGRKLHSKVSLLRWRSDSEEQGEPWLRLIVGSANLTRKGFRENYECVASFDYGGGPSGPPGLLWEALAHLRRIAEGSRSPQLRRQIEDLEKGLDRHAPEPEVEERDVVLVAGEAVIPVLTRLWSGLSSTPPRSLTLCSPFWPEGEGSAEYLADVATAFGTSADLKLVCRGSIISSGDHLVPEFDSRLARDLAERLGRGFHLCPALPAFGSDDTSSDGLDDETEDAVIAVRSDGHADPGEGPRRALHAKLVAAEGEDGAVLYIGSANCTRRGLGGGGPMNWEAGVAYRLDRKDRRRIRALLRFTGPAVEVTADAEPKTASPREDHEEAVPGFLEEVTARDSNVTIRFRAPAEVPADVVIRMPVPEIVHRDMAWLLVRGRPASFETTVDLAACPLCGEEGATTPVSGDEIRRVPNVFVQVCWDGHQAEYPVRFDQKAELPVLLAARRHTETELIDYFLWGRDPGEPSGELPWQVESVLPLRPDEPIDTRGILAYFIRRFVQAIPGLEQEILAASRSRVALEAALRGPTSPRALADQAYASLGASPGRTKPRKTSISVGFQLVEIIAALRRCRETVEDLALKACFDPVLGHCLDLVGRLERDHPELRKQAFRAYRARFAGGQR